MRNVISWTCIIAGLVLLVFSISANIYGYLQTRNVDGWLAQARHVGTAERMATYCNLATTEMERLGMTDGYVVTIPQIINPQFDMAVKYQVVKSIEDRAQFAALNTELNTIQQSQALADLRNALGSFRLMGTNWYILNHGFFFKLAYLWGLQWLILIAIGIGIHTED